MKRFKDCQLVCNPGQTPEELLSIIGTECKKNGICVDFYSSFSGNDTLTKTVVLTATKDIHLEKRFPASTGYFHSCREIILIE